MSLHVCLLICAFGFARGLSVESVCVVVCAARGFSVDSAAGAVYRINLLIYICILVLNDKNSSKQSNKSIKQSKLR